MGQRPWQDYITLKVDGANDLFAERINARWQGTSMGQRPCKSQVRLLSPEIQVRPILQTKTMGAT